MLPGAGPDEVASARSPPVISAAFLKAFQQSKKNGKIHVLQIVSLPCASRSFGAGHGGAMRFLCNPYTGRCAKSAFGSHRTLTTGGAPAAGGEPQGETPGNGPRDCCR